MKEIVIKLNGVYSYVAAEAVVRSVVSQLSEIDVEYNESEKEIVVIGDEVRLETVSLAIKDVIQVFRRTIVMK